MPKRLLLMYFCFFLFLFYRGIHLIFAESTRFGHRFDSFHFTYSGFFILIHMFCQAQRREIFFFLYKLPSLQHQYIFSLGRYLLIRLYCATQRCADNLLMSFCHLARKRDVALPKRLIHVLERSAKFVRRLIENHCARFVLDLLQMPPSLFFVYG